MADSTSHKSQKIEKHKYSNMINRTTSESIRLSESDRINHPTTLSATSTTPKKKTSFQITSVTIGGHNSNDGGEDSADDLDESHAEDISDVIDTSRATDIENETPSYSEDTFSKDDVFFNSSTSLGTAPVIPTSSQYGLAIVSTPEGCSSILNSNVPGESNPTSNDLHVNVSDNVINLGIVGSKHLEGEMRDLHNHTTRNERFKVVKIESTEPFKRGRWMCMDYLDHTMLQHQQHQLQSQGSVTNANPARLAESNDTSNMNQCTGTDSGISMSDHPNTISTLDEHVHIDNSANLGSSIIVQEVQNLNPHSAPSGTVHNSISPGQTTLFNAQNTNIIQPIINASQSQVIQQQAQSLTAVPNQHSLIGTTQHQSLQQQQMQQVISNSNIIGQQSAITTQQIQQPVQQMHQNNPMQHLHQIHQQQGSTNMVTQQQYQQPQPQIQPIHHPQTSIQTVQQTNAQQPIIQQANIPQHMQQQPVQQVQHHNVPISLQQQINQGQMPVQVPQTVGVLQSQGNIQQMQQQTQLPVHSQMQPAQQQHMQHVTVQQMPIGSVVGTTQVLPSQTQQQYHLPTSQPVMQPGIQSQSNLIPVQQTQYYTNPQMQGTSIGMQPMANPLLQPQNQANPNISIQQTYSVNPLNPQQPQQIPIVHPIPPTSIPHMSQSQIPTSVVSVMMPQPNPLTVVNNLPIPTTQNTVISPQATSQGASIVQQYVPQQGVSSVAPTQVSVGSQSYPASAVNTVPSIVENVQVYPVEIPNEQTISNTQQSELGSDNMAAEETQQIEDAESASGASAVAIDNKIEQAMDLVKSHLMFAVREEVEVLKEKIAELMDRINQLEMENAVLKANATQETLAQLSSTMQPPTSNAL